MSKILLRVMVILEVHDVYEAREVRPTQGEVKQSLDSREKQSLAQNGSITILTINLKIQGVGSSFYRLRRTIMQP